MTSLSVRLAKAMEFDGQLASAEFYDNPCLDSNCDAHSYEQGAKYENARLKPFLEVLIECEIQLEDAHGYLCLEKCNHFPGNIWHSPACKTRNNILTKLQTLLDAKEGE